jgi:hypothetical protein
MTTPGSGGGGTAGLTPGTTKFNTLLNAKDDYYKKISANFRRRSFLTLEEQEYFISEKVRMLLKEECQNCRKILFPKDLMKLTARIESDNGIGGSNSGAYAGGNINTTTT